MFEAWEPILFFACVEQLFPHLEDIPPVGAERTQNWRCNGVEILPFFKSLHTSNKEEREE